MAGTIPQQKAAVAFSWVFLAGAAIIAFVAVATVKFFSMERTPSTAQNDVYTQWLPGIDRTTILTGDWKPIASGRLDGFGPGIIERRTENCGANEARTYLRSGGGLCRVGFWLEVDGRVIDSREKLLQRFGGLQTTERAVSFIGVTQGDLVISNAGVLEGTVRAMDNGFLVQVVRKNSFGCSDHKPTKEIHLVTSAGEITRIAWQNPGPGTLCID